MRKSKVMALALAMVMLLGVLAACGPTEDTTTAPQGGGTTAPGTTAPVTTAPPVQAKKVYRTYLSTECPILNGHDSVESVLQTPHNYCSSPLYRAYPNENGTGFIYIGDLAEELPIQIDDTNWQIKLRKDAKWHNGDPINADTFMYSFKMQLDPILANQMANFLADYSIAILNAKEYSLQGESNTVAWDNVGIKKIDEYTIQITTVNPNTQNDVCNHFTDRSTFPVYEPLYEAGMNASRTETDYGSTLEKWMGCGPYKFKQWEFDSIHVYEKNEDHWLADLFNYDTVEVRIIPSMNARVELWEQGKLDDLVPDGNTIDTYIDDPRMVNYATTSVYHIDINCKNPDNPLSGIVEYRKALYHAIDREVLARDLFGYMKPTGTYINGQAGILSPDGVTFRDSAQGKAVTSLVDSWGPYGYNPELARQYLAEAYKKAGISDDTVVKVIMAVGDTENNWKATAEFLEQQWPVIFEGKIKLEISTYAGMSATDFKKTGDNKWDLSPNDWSRGASRTYPYTAFYYYLSSYGSAPNNYFVPEFDAQYEVCDSAELKTNYSKMYDETQKLEEMYLDYVIHIPVVQSITYQLFSDRLVLPVKTYLPGFGWGTLYGDINE